MARLDKTSHVQSANNDTGVSMNRLLNALFIIAVLFLASGTSTAYTCSWGAYANGMTAIVARTMDSMGWYTNDNAIVKGHGRNIEEISAGTQNAYGYTSKYASIRIHSFYDIVTDAMNEKGLQISALLFEGSLLPNPISRRKDVTILNFIPYVIANFATVDEVIASLDNINIIEGTLNVTSMDGKTVTREGKDVPLHFAMADTSGDKAIIEFINGEMKVYHGKEHNALTNEPSYDVHLALEATLYQPNATVNSIDRRARMKGYLRDMAERGVDDHKRALFGMRGLLARSFAGTEEIDRRDDRVYPTVWMALADQTERKYYVSRCDAWKWEVYNFTMFDSHRPEVRILKAADVK
ncbi:MAG: linear amide C-N hydrolase [Desulfovibrio sp.]|nr:linear amide C-N hydrolase [Desulfovibrio sp.]